MQPPEHVVHQAQAGARVLTLRGVLIRAVSIGSNLLLLGLVTPAEFGLLAVVRGITGIIGQTADFGVTWALVRRPRDPTRDEYAALLGVQAAIAIVAFIVASVWPGGLLSLGGREGPWRGWMLAAIAVMVVTPFGMGARIRLQRNLAYARTAFVDVSGVLLQNLLLLGFAWFGHFSTGIFVAHIAVTLYTACLFYASSPGPSPTLRLRALTNVWRDYAGFSATHVLWVSWEYGIPVLMAKLFGLQIAGYWNFAARFGQLVVAGFEGFGNAALPVAARLASDAVSMRRLATNSLTGAAAFTLPAAGVLVVIMPVLARVWPQWESAVPLAQLYVLSFSIWGVVAAGLRPVAVAVRGSTVTIVELLSVAAVAWLGFPLLWWAGRDDIALVVLPLHLAPAVSLALMTDRGIRPSWNSELSRSTLSVLTGLSLYALFGFVLPLQPLLTAAIACCGMLAWWPIRRGLAHLRGRLSALPGNGRARL